MFERRLKIFLSILILVTAAMLVRAVQLQVFGAAHWQTQAVESMKRPRLIETTRGTILDAKGEKIAVDEACIDAAVDFRAIVDPPDPEWVTQQAIARVRRDLGDSYLKVSAGDRKERIAKQKLVVAQDLNQMWRALAEERNPTNPKAALEEIDDIRRGIVERVQMRRRYVWYKKYQEAVADQKGEAAPWYSKWLLDEQGEGPDVDNFTEDVGEQEAAHSILPDVSNDTLARLKKNRARYPGLTFPDSTDRRYPFRTAAAHVLGRLSKVMREDILKDPNLGKNELREYQRNDLIGRMGLEALCEPVLRGTRGQVVRVAGEETEISRVESVPGRDVQTTLDIRLQRDVEELFTKVKLDKVTPELEMHGAAVVIDVATGAVRALASWPNYDANRFDEDYAALSTDDINQPLVNRATQWVIEPGSTVKPIIGLGAITDGVCGANTGIECTGYLTIRGTTYKAFHRCWVAKMYGASHPDLVPHHQIPSPHRGHAGNPDGFLTFADALERSCNVYFQNLADQMGVGGMVKWFRAFGLGRPTGIGIAEARGWLPSAEGMTRQHILSDTWNAGIGQGQVGATTLQMANVAATVARDGVWVRPHLVDPKVATTRPAGMPQLDGPDRVDLKLSHAGILAAKRGMDDAVYGDGGTTTFDDLRRADVRVAGKTGSAQAPPLRTPIRDGRGNPTYECAKCAAPAPSLVEQKQWQCSAPAKKEAAGPQRPSSGLTPVSLGSPDLAKADAPKLCENKRRLMRRTIHAPRSPQNPDAPIAWYRGFGPDGTTLSHAWFIGYAPAENPQVAFAVMIEYGGSGGYAAGGVANGVIDACIRHGYLRTSPNVASAR